MFILALEILTDKLLRSKTSGEICSGLTYHNYLFLSSHFRSKFANYENLKKCLLKFVIGLVCKLHKVRLQFDENPDLFNAF